MDSIGGLSLVKPSLELVLHFKLGASASSLVVWRRGARKINCYYDGVDSDWNVFQFSDLSFFQRQE
jgi:hypothetical protein